MAPVKGNNNKKKKEEGAKSRTEAKGVGILTVAGRGRRGGSVVGRARGVFSAKKAKKHAANPDPPPSFLPKGPIKIRAKSDLTGL